MGFTPEVFTNPYILRIGADKLVALHTPFKGAREKRAVEKTISDVEKVFHTKIAIQVMYSEAFSSLVEEAISLLNRFGKEDRIYVHLGSGQRHISLALIYAASFSDRKITLIPTMEFGFEKGKEFRYELVPPIPVYKLTRTQKNILKLVLEKEGQTLTELASRVGEDHRKAAPAVLRHLRALVSLNLITGKGKKYTASSIAKFFI